MGRPRLPVGTHGEIRCYQLPSGKYRAITNYRDYDGVLRPVERVGTSETNAKNNLRAALRDRARAVVGEEVTDRTRVAAVADMWLRELDESCKALRTKRTYRESWDRDLVQAVGELTVQEVTVATAERVLRAIRDRAGLGSARHAKVVLTGVMGLAVRYGALDTNPVREIGALGTSKKPREAPKKLTEITWDEYRRLRTFLVASSAAERADLVDLVDILAATGAILAATGARIGELLALDWTRVDVDRRTLKLEGTVIREPGTGLFVQPHTKSSAGMRTIKVPRWAADVFAKRQANADAEWVFASASGSLRDPDNTRKSLRRVLAETDWEGLHPHAFRHLVATRLDEAGLSAREIVDYLSHAQVSMTQDVYMNRRTVGGAAADALEGLGPEK